MARILAIGGAHIDRKGWLSAPHRPGASNPGRWESEAGGGVFNAARNLSRLGHQVTLVAPRGGDAAAEAVARAAEEAGLEDCPLTFLDRATPSYSAILEPDGNLVTALADMALYDLIPARRLLTSRLRKRLGQADLLLMPIPTCPQAPSPRLAEAAASHRRCRLAVIAVSPAKVVRWKQSLANISCLAMNAAEAAALTGARPITRDWQSLLARRRPDGRHCQLRRRPGGRLCRIGRPCLHRPPAAARSGARCRRRRRRAGLGLSRRLAGGRHDRRQPDPRHCAGPADASVRGPVRQDLSPELLARRWPPCQSPAQ
jgi:pseudouridine kinase